MNKVKLQLVLDKVGTIVVDRRFWVSLFTLLSIIFGIPELANNANYLSGEALDLVVLVAQILGLLLVPFGLVISWANRPPSGLNYKEAVSQLAQDLRDLGIE